MPNRMAGYGPISQRPPSPHALGGGILPDANIYYQDMAHRQMVDQYHQQQLNPAHMSYRDLTRLTEEPGATSHVPGAHEHYSYLRKMRREAADIQMAGAAARAATGYGSFSVGFGMAKGAVGAIGLTGLGASIASLGAASLFAAPIGMMLGAGIDHHVQHDLRRKAIQSDTFTYRHQLGLMRPTADYADQAGAAAFQHIQQRGAGGGFFGQEDLATIFKSGTANNLISATKQGSIDSGTISQLIRNMDEFFDTTEEIVKFMNTTKEGAMSLIQEMQQGGFGNVNQIRNAVRAASAMGAGTGVGAQNMLNIAAAGAQASVGTPFTAQTGMQAYMQAGTAAGFMTQGGTQAQQRAVAAVGGVGAAADVLGRSQMNFMASDIFSTMMAAAMDPATGKLEQGKLDRLMTGPASAFNTHVAAQATGHGMGSRRAMFDKYRVDAFAQLGEMGVSPEMAMRRGFEIWRTQFPHAGTEESLYQWSKMMSGGDLNEAGLIFETMWGPQTHNAQHRAAAMQQMMEHRPTVRQSDGLRGLATASWDHLLSPFANALGGEFIDAGKAVGSGFAYLWRGGEDTRYGGISGTATRFGDWGLRFRGVDIERFGFDDIQRIGERMYGAGRDPITFEQRQEMGGQIASRALSALDESRVFESPEATGIVTGLMREMQQERIKRVGDGQGEAMGLQAVSALVKNITGASHESGGIAGFLERSASGRRQVRALHQEYMSRGHAGFTETDNEEEMARQIGGAFANISMMREADLVEGDTVLSGVLRDLGALRVSERGNYESEVKRLRGKREGRRGYWRTEKLGDEIDRWDMGVLAKLHADEDVASDFDEYKSLVDKRTRGYEGDFTTILETKEDKKRREEIGENLHKRLIYLQMESEGFFQMDGDGKKEFASRLGVSIKKRGEVYDAGINAEEKQFEINYNLLDGGRARTGILGIFGQSGRELVSAVAELEKEEAVDRVLGQLQTFRMVAHARDIEMSVGQEAQLVKVLAKGDKDAFNALAVTGGILQQLHGGYGARNQIDEFMKSDNFTSEGRRSFMETLLSQPGNAQIANTFNLEQLFALNARRQDSATIKQDGVGDLEITRGEDGLKVKRGERTIATGGDAQEMVNNLLAEAKYRTGQDQARGPGQAINPAPPILNYWNNRWIL